MYLICTRSIRRKLGCCQAQGVEQQYWCLSGWPSEKVASPALVQSPPSAAPPRPAPPAGQGPITAHHRSSTPHAHPSSSCRTCMHLLPFSVALASW